MSKIPPYQDTNQPEIVASRSNTGPLFCETVAPAFKIIVSELDGKRIAYSSETEFLVQIGKGSKGSYRTHYKIKGNLAQACLLYRGINVGNGYKKRLLAPSMNKPTLAKQISFDLSG